MLQPIDQIKYNKGFKNETQLYGHRDILFVPTPVRYGSEQVENVRSTAQANTWYHQQLIAQNTTGIIKMPQERKFVLPVTQISNNSVGHDKECALIRNGNTEKLIIAPDNNKIPSPSKFAVNVNAKKWVTANKDGSMVTQTHVRSPFIQEFHNSMDENDMVPHFPVSPRPLLGSSNIDNLIVSNLVTEENQKLLASNMKLKLCGTSDQEKMFIFTGTVERVIKWNKIFCNHVCYFEVIATVLSIEEGSMKSQMIMLLRDKKGGPILQMVYYTNTYFALQDFYIGQMLRCVGKMNGRNIFNAISIRAATSEEVENLQRLCCVCDQAVSQHYLNV